MARRIEQLSPGHLDALAEPSASCLFWQLDPVRRARVPAGAATAEKQVWLGNVLTEWGSCGRVVVQDDVAVGYILYAPARFAPGALALPTAPVSPDALLLATVSVAAPARGRGLGRVLVQAMARDLLERGSVHLIEAFGDTRDGRGGPLAARECPGRCVLPAGFLTSVGFKTQRAHGTTPRLRMDLRSTLTWRVEVEHALDRLRTAVTPPRPVAGASSAGPNLRPGTPAAR